MSISAISSSVTASASTGLGAAMHPGAGPAASSGAVAGSDASSYASSSTHISATMGSMAEQVLTLLAAAVMLDAIGGDKDKDQDKGGALGLALALAMMGTQQASTYHSTASSVTMQGGAYDAGGQATTGAAATGTLLNVMA